MVSNKDLARWLHEEHSRLDTLRARLQEIIAGVPRVNRQHWIDELRTCFDHYRAHAQKHMALEEKDGYMNWAVELIPALGVEVQRLESEHGEFTRLLDDLQKFIAQLRADDQLMIREACRRVDAYLAYVRHHESDENRMALTAYMQDIGAKD